jgi:hypothetical protein
MLTQNLHYANSDGHFHKGNYIFLKLFRIERSSIDLKHFIAPKIKTILPAVMIVVDIEYLVGLGRKIVVKESGV